MENSVIYVFHGRLPDPRAAAIFAVQEIRSLAARISVTMVVPKRNTTNLEEARKQYRLPEQIELVSLPVIEFTHVPILKRFAFEFSLISFSYRLAKYLRNSSAEWIITTDHLPALVAKWCGKKVLIEIHDFPSTWNPIWRLLLARADIVLSTNTWKANELNSRFKVPRGRIFVERNGVDLEHFAPCDKSEARSKLGLPLDVAIALYAGSLYSWKGAETLIDAAKFMPDIMVYVVGGTPEDQERLGKQSSNNVHFVPRVAHDEIQIWLSSADVLVLPNTAEEVISQYYTSPMKLFEYMASERPIVASDLPSIREILSEDSGFFFKPDSPESVANAIMNVISERKVSMSRASRARELVCEYSWEKRAERILGKIFK